MGFAECFTATQKSSQAMQHFLHKRSSSAAASSSPKMAPTQQPVKAAPPAVQLADRKRKGLSLAAAGAPIRKPLLCLLAPRSVPGADGSDCEKFCCEHWVLSHSAHTANRCYSEKNKTQTYPKREHFSSSPYHEPQAPARLNQPFRMVTSKQTLSQICPGVWFF